MRTTPTVIYVVMAVWLVFAAAGRVALQLTGKQPLDFLPFASAAIGAIALVVLFIPADRRK